MARPGGNPNLWKSGFKKGQSGNPGGKLRHMPAELQKDLLTALVDDFKEHGTQAVAAAREESPIGYLKVCASLLPKEVKVRNVTEDLSVEDLEEVVVRLRDEVEAAGGARDVTPPKEEREQVSGLPAVH